jgi:C_GCAxxG_C_C family probable redox protein
MRDDGVFKAASGWGGGIGQMNDVCGSLLGASMALSMKYGRGREEIEDFEKVKSSYLPVAKLYKWFEKEFGSATCRGIRTRMAGGVFYDTKVPWQAELAKEAGLAEMCAELVAKTCARTAEMLWDDAEE